MAAPTVRRAKLTETYTLRVQVEQQCSSGTVWDAPLIASCSESCDSSRQPLQSSFERCCGSQQGQNCWPRSELLCPGMHPAVLHSGQQQGWPSSLGSEGRWPKR